MESTLASHGRHQEFTRSHPLTRAALGFAEERHAGQRRAADNAPFVIHPIEVATLLHEAGYPDHVIAAGALHDVIEDTDTESAEISQRFGPDVAQLVTTLTENPAIEDDAERKAALRSQVARAGGDAAAVFAADKISKARELRMQGEGGLFDRASRAKLDHYDASLEILADLMPDHEFVERLRRELEALHNMPPGSA